MDAVIAAIIGGAVTVFNVVFSTIMANKRTKDDRAKNIENGLQCLLRAEIIRSHDKYKDKGFCPLYAKEALTRAYKAYHALGGNDVATNLYNECMILPDKAKEDDDEQD